MDPAGVGQNQTRQIEHDIKRKWISTDEPGVLRMVWMNFPASVSPALLLYANR
jgi:hypothetical protein